MTSRRRTPGLTLDGAALAHAGPGIAGVPGVTRHVKAGQPARAGNPSMALTFDDGPHPSGTPAVLEWTHRRLLTVGPAATMADLRRARNLICGAAGARWRQDGCDICSLARIDGSR